MSNVVEIYICNEGQDLKQGRLETSQEIANRTDAEADAQYRCSEDNAIQKIAYYSLTDEGDAKKLLIYENPHFSGATAKAGAPRPNGKAAPSGGKSNGNGAATAKRAGGGAKPKGNWLVNRLINMVTEEVPR
ncbi:MAG: hypothetical protein HOK61_00005 [Alphaproteobacteria bacterium]|nr:hypothetical protein [Alphaproteobacteria bacterium]